MDILVIADEDDWMKGAETEFGRLSSALRSDSLAAERLVETNIQIVDGHFAVIGHARESRRAKGREGAILDTRSQIDHHQSLSAH